MNILDIKKVWYFLFTTYAFHISQNAKTTNCGFFSLSQPKLKRLSHNRESESLAPTWSMRRKYYCSKTLNS